MNGHEHARNLLTLARKDLTALRAMGDPQFFTDEICGFHAQQAIEKTLKAWAAICGLEYPFKHDLGHLLAILESAGEKVEPFWSLVEYTDFGVRFRYETLDEGDSPLDREGACAEVAGLLGM
jgi:hypothetical protein